MTHDSANAARGQAVSLGWDHRDRHRWLTGLAAAAVASAVGMAIFGLPPVDLHGPLHKVGIMDPFCGGTRAARYTAQWRLVEAWRYNPLSILIVLGGLAAVVRAVVGLTTRRWLTLAVAWTPRRRGIAIVVIGLLLLALEVRQQLRADLLMEDTYTWR